jgi:glutamate racemase
LNGYAIGIFDSGYGGLTVMKEIVRRLPRYDYIYLGDNARAPYGTRSFETVYRYTLEAVKWLFSQECGLIVLACNTASAKALRNIQQKDLPLLYPGRRVLGVIRPLTEIAGSLTGTGHLGLFGTTGTVRSGSYKIEIEKFFPGIRLTQEPCPMWVPLIENNEFAGDGALYFIGKNVESLLRKDSLIDAIILGCTHYSIMDEQIRKCLPEDIALVSQGKIVARALDDYLKRHPEIDGQLSGNGRRMFYTTDSSEDFDSLGALFYGGEIVSNRVELF